MEKLSQQANNSLKKDIVATLADWIDERSLAEGELNLESIADQIIDIQSVNCKCRSRKCAPHRCWPSKVSWIILGVMMLIVWYVMGEAYSKRSAERSSMLAEWNKVSSEKFSAMENTIDKYAQIVNDYSMLMKEAKTYVELNTIPDRKLYWEAKRVLREIEESRWDEAVKSAKKD